MVTIGKRKYRLLDDGTMDTVVEVSCPCGCHWEERFSLEAAADYRDPNTGSMVAFRDFINDWLDDEPCLDCGN